MNNNSFCLNGDILNCNPLQCNKDNPFDCRIVRSCKCDCNEDGNYKNCVETTPDGCKCDKSLETKSNNINSRDIIILSMIVFAIGIGFVLRNINKSKLHSEELIDGVTIATLQGLLD